MERTFISPPSVALCSCPRSSNRGGKEPKKDEGTTQWNRRRKKEEVETKNSKAGPNADLKCANANAGAHHRGTSVGLACCVTQRSDGNHTFPLAAASIFIAAGGKPHRGRRSPAGIRFVSPANPERPEGALQPTEPLFRPRPHKGRGARGGRGCPSRA